MIYIILLFVITSLAKSPLSDENRDYFKTKTEHKRTLFFSNDWTKTTVDNFQFAAVPFPSKSSSQIYDETKMNYNQYEDALILEGWWFLVMACAVVVISFLWYLARPCLGGVRGTQGCFCPKPFKKASGEGYSYIHVKWCQIIIIGCFIISIILILLLIMYNASIRAKINAVRTSSDNTVDSVDRNIRIIQSAFNDMPFESQKQDFDNKIKMMSYIKDGVEKGVGSLSDYVKEYNRSREGLELFAIYITSFMLGLLLFAACTFHYQMASGLSIFGWLLAAVFIIAASVTYPMDIAVADACLVGDKILNSDSYETQSVVLYYFPVNDPSVTQMIGLFEDKLLPETISKMKLFLEEHCGKELLCNSFPADSLTVSNYDDYRNVPFIHNTTILYSYTSCAQYCDSANKKVAKEYGDYYSTIDAINSCVKGPLESLRHGEPFENYLFNVMSFMCTKDLHTYTFVTTCLSCAVGLVIWIISFISMLAGKRFNKHNRSRATEKEISFRGTANQYELPNFNLIDY
ncbi:hypothetical protein ENUP19_0172G0024 [Entamoeba nuttalli]|uniref:Uncharacterized protein n=2 Tax=Entamoeba nuttalli TaxID=412467 RepID=K2H116_ENTNP|nr:hypothetical protein ENU1_065380 [Entamoeba nuttalli P19]EKE41178.1 hypothetical protein ENU1_065380 [Entamoeba nuttalli P19]|eukprot:XP_008856486.1 hypothetical protein ENU1_065380 [Entamoeba nuttalli P19]